MSLANKNYIQFDKSTNYLFLNNNYGFAKSLKGKLKTINAFSLGGLNFKGFDYKGMDHMMEVSISEMNISHLHWDMVLLFIFDDKDNINLKFF